MAVRYAPLFQGAAGAARPSSSWTRPPSIREIIIALASFIFAVLLFRDSESATYQYYTNLPKQIIYKWKGLPSGPVKTILVFGDSVRLQLRLDCKPSTHC